MQALLFNEKDAFIGKNANLIFQGIKLTEPEIPWKAQTDAMLYWWKNNCNTTKYSQFPFATKSILRGTKMHKDEPAWVWNQSSR